MKNTLQPDYTLTGNVYQLVIPIDIGEMIPADDLARLLSAVLERMDHRKLYATYSRWGDETWANAIQLRMEGSPPTSVSKVQARNHWRSEVKKYLLFYASITLPTLQKKNSSWNSWARRIDTFRPVQWETPKSSILKSLKA